MDNVSPKGGAMKLKLKPRRKMLLFAVDIGQRQYARYASLRFVSMSLTQGAREAVPTALFVMIKNKWLRVTRYF